jgi:hypothetical protein
MEPSATRIAPQKRYFVRVEINGKGAVIHYFNERYGSKGAEMFYYDYCEFLKIKPVPLVPSDNYARVAHTGVIIDFEKISELTIQSIFDLN